MLKCKTIVKHLIRKSLNIFNFIIFNYIKFLLATGTPCRGTRVREVARSLVTSLVIQAD